MLSTGHTLKGIVAAGRTHDGPNHRQFVHHPGHAGEKLTDVNARYVGSNGLEFTAYFRGGLGLDIVHVLVRRPSRQKDHDDRLVRGRARLGLRSQDVRQGQTSHAQGPDPQKVSPGYPITKPPLLFAEKCYHRFTSFPGKRILDEPATSAIVILSGHSAPVKKQNCLTKNLFETLRSCGAEIEIPSPGTEGGLRIRERSILVKSFARFSQDGIRFRGPMTKASRPPLANASSALAVAVVCLSLCFTGSSRAGLNQWTSQGPFGRAVASLAIDPTTPPPTVYAATAKAGVFKSRDGGAHWRAVNQGLVQLDVRSLVLDAGDPSTLYVAAGGQVFKSRDGGAHWTAAGGGLGEVDVRVLVIAPRSPSTLYAGTSSGVFKSTDQGKHWKDEKIVDSLTPWFRCWPSTPGVPLPCMPAR